MKKVRHVKAKSIQLRQKRALRHKPRRAAANARYRRELKEGREIKERMLKSGMLQRLTGMTTK